MKKTLYAFFGAGVVAVAIFMAFRFVHSMTATDPGFEELQIDMGLRPDPAQSEQFSPDQLTDVFGDQATFDVISGAETIDIMLINPRGLDGKWASLSEYPVEGGPVRMPEQDAERTKDTISNARNFGWSIRKGCLPSPGVRMTFTKNDQSVDVLCCFACNVLGVYSGDELVGGEDFDMIRPQLIRTIKPLFPNSKLIQGLKEKL